MPLDKPGTLSRQQNADVIAFVLRANAWPSRQVGAAGGFGRPEADQRSKPISLETLRPV